MNPRSIKSPSHSNRTGVSDPPCFNHRLKPTLLFKVWTAALKRCSTQKFRAGGWSSMTGLYRDESPGGVNGSRSIRSPTHSNRTGVSDPHGRVYSHGRV